MQQNYYYNLFVREGWLPTHSSHAELGLILLIHFNLKVRFQFYMYKAANELNWKTFYKSYNRRTREQKISVIVGSFYIKKELYKYQVLRFLRVLKGFHQLSLFGKQVLINAAFK